MTEKLLSHISRFATLNNEAIVQIGQVFELIELPKRAMVVEEGTRCQHIYFVAKGCLRMYYLDEKGTENTIQFALENWWMTDLEAFNKNISSSFSIQAIEHTTLLAINKEKFDKLLRDHHPMETYFRMIYERAFSASLFRMKFFRLPKDEFYAMFCEAYPDFIQRIPQKLLASFLGFTPEYLSELRSRIGKES
ncbi:MAG: Crp/Fnr family transcriptional regulator [Pedobacter sp.]|nr:MAG: Crp/Fnr family transcriptional regulator [Pedobacter sp.]